MKRTPLFEYHSEKSKLVEFAGYEMPIWYTSIVDEHLAVRENVGIFDVSHMGRVIVNGSEATEYLDSIVPTAVSSQPTGKSFYTLFLNDQSGIIDDLIIIKTGDQEYLVVINAANTQKDIDHMRKISEEFDAEIREITSDSTMIAIQGPRAQAVLQPLTKIDLREVKRFRHIKSNINGNTTIITRTGYTGEDGFEIILLDSGVSNNAAAMSVWNKLAEKARPCGLGARDSLRIEAGLPLYGSDIDENTNPIEADLYWVVSREKDDFIGSKRLKELSSIPPAQTRRGLILNDKIPRAGFKVLNEENAVIGRVTSGTFSPVLRQGIAMAYIETSHSRFGCSVKVKVRDSDVKAIVTKPPFYDETKYGWKRTGGDVIHQF